MLQTTDSSHVTICQFFCFVYEYMKPACNVTVQPAEQSKLFHFISQEYITVEGKSLPDCQNEQVTIQDGVSLIAQHFLFFSKAQN